MFAVDCEYRQLINFTQKLIQTRSLPGEEGEVAELIAREMEKLRYDNVEVDGIGNVIGKIEGFSNKPIVMFNGHMDHVAAGPRELWPVDPYSAEIFEDAIWGRGAADMKGALAAMIYAGGKIVEQFRDMLNGTIYVTCVVMEEPSLECIGMKYLFEKDRLKTDYVIIGEATNFDIANGGRGRIEVEIKTYGKACHSSAPWRGINALYKMAKVLLELEKLNEKLPSHPILGKSSLAVTAINCRPGIPDYDTIPDEATIILERRLVPPENEETALRQFQELLNRLAREDPEFKASVKIREVKVRDYLGNIHILKKVMGRPWIIDENHPLVQEAARIVAKVIGRKPKIRPYTFGTDANYTAGVLGIPTIGIGPGEERYTHTYEDHIKIRDLINACQIYFELMTKITGKISK